jgi:type II secretory pathway pseudopilin PulG
MATPRSAGGFTIAELAVVVGVFAIAAMFIMPALGDFLLKHQLTTSASEVEGLVLRARMGALKEKISYRVVIHDEAATTPNRLEVQRRPSGSWVTLPDGIRDLPSTVRVLGASPSDSMDDMVVDGRGLCETGRVFLESDLGSTETVSVESTCLSTRL